MAEEAQAHHIQVILCSITPVLHFQWESAPTPRVLAVSQWTQEVNLWLKRYAAERGFGYVDYFAVLHDQRELRLAGFTNDGWHPNTRGHGCWSERLIES
jgi:lysophospholipase L1-like esterase